MKTTYSHLLVLVAAASLTVGVTVVAAAPTRMPGLVRLQAASPQVSLAGRYATARVLVDAVYADGSVRDGSAQAVYTSRNPDVAGVSETGIVQGRRAGATTLSATLTVGGVTKTVQVPVRVGVSRATPRFNTDVMPILTKLSCNSGPCHGANAGKGGFHLSLLGYDPEGDYEALTRFVGARRISPAQPDNSLLLRKATGRVRHGGGVRFDPASSEYRTLRDWIAGGAKAPVLEGKGAEPFVTRLDVSPSQRLLGIGRQQRYRVVAAYSDGSRQDVTSRTLFSTGDGAILDVQKDGTAKVVGPGEGAVVIRYGGVFTTARLTAPFGPKLAPTPTANPLDRLINRKLADLGVPLSPPCTDGEFLRRATLDVTGKLPSAEAVRRFLADKSPNKRVKLVDSLLASPDYVDFWTNYWSDLLRNSKNSLGAKGVKVYHDWIRKQVADNTPYDKWVRELLLAQGNTYESGPVNFYHAGTDPEIYQVSPPEDLGETTAQLFAGVRLQCARCHNHPFEKWRQNQFYELASFYGQMKGEAGKETPEKKISVQETGDVYHPKTGKPMRPTPLDGTPLPADFKGDRRAALADWLTARNNPFFAPLVANRLWKRYMGRGLVEPVDDFRVTNPATNDPLLTYLAGQVKAQRYDLKAVMRQILLSDAYGRSSRMAPGNEKDTRYHSRFIVKRLTAEQMLDAINDLTGAAEKFDGYPEGTRAMQLMDTTVASYFLDAFGRPPRQTTCDCERTGEANVGQALHLMNNPAIQAKLDVSGGRIKKLQTVKATPAQMVNDLYLSAFARYPTAPEKTRAVKWLDRAQTPAQQEQAAQDLLWAILNSKEFAFNH